MQIPVQLLDSLDHVKGFDRKSFERVHLSGEQVTSVRINPLKISSPFSNLHILKFPHFPIPWTPYGYYLETRPSFTFDPSFHAGCYYVQEASSMFLEQALKQTTDLSQPLKVLDLCAAPGGKSTHIQSLITKDSLLVSNDVIRTRANVLKDNIIKWGVQNVIVTNNDPADFSKLNGYFDVIVVDAPCSGSGLFRRDPGAIEEWSPNNVQLCSQRQQRILADVWPALKEDGILIYSTCSYSKEEDEDIVNWLMSEWSLADCKLSSGNDWGITTSDIGYRFWPDKVKGEGLFVACFRKTSAASPVAIKIKNKPEVLNRAEIAIAGDWVQKEGFHFIKYQQTVYGWPEKLVADFSFLLNHLRVLYSGTIIGELLRDKMIPDHALAMSTLVRSSIDRTELDYDSAIQYLKRKELLPGTMKKGWQLVSYEGQILGWVNVLSNRLNNYYPKELRILKDN